MDIKLIYCMWRL